MTHNTHQQGPLLAPKELRFKKRGTVNVFPRSRRYTDTLLYSFVKTSLADYNPTLEVATH